MLHIDDSISKTKIVLPRRRIELLSRQRLLEILYERLDRKLLIVSAAAGYGKTSLLIDLANHSDLPFCWLALDPLDREPQRFIACLIASIAERFPGFGKRSRSMLEGMISLDESVERLLVTLVNEIYADIHEHFVLVLDDFHVLDDDALVLYIFNRFIQLVGEHCHVVLASRTVPELRDMALLVAREDVGGIDYSDLAFRAGEFQALLAQNRQIHLSDDDAEKLIETTEGWITGLQFTDLGEKAAASAAFRTPQRVGVSLFDFLGRQVLEQQPDEVQLFMLRSSLLEEFDARLCEQVLGPLYEQAPDWFKLIETLVQKNLFTLPLGTDGQWLRYHHLFRDYLQDRLRRERPAEVDIIRRTLAQEEERRGQWERAYQLYRQTGDTEAIAGLIERAGIPMWQHALITLDSWMKALTPSVIESRPQLLSLQANIELSKGNPHNSLQLFENAIQVLRERKDGEGLALALVRQANAYRFLSRYGDAIRNADEVLTKFRPTDDQQWIHADALRVKGLSHYRLGHAREALDYLGRAYDIYVRLGDAASIPLLLMELGVAHSATGDYARAKSDYESALKIWREEGNISLQANLLNDYGFLHQQLGEYEEAVAALEEALLCAQQSGYKRMQALIGLSLGDVYCEVADYEVAAQTYNQVSDLIDQIDEPFLKNYLGIALTNLAILQEDAPRARALLDRAAPAIQAGKSLYENGLLELLYGRLEMQEHNTRGALPHLREARRSFTRDGREMESIWSAIWLAAAEYETGSHAAARREMHAAVPHANQVSHAALVAARQACDWLEGLRKDPELRAGLRGLFDKLDRTEIQLPATRRQLHRLAHTIEMPTPRLVIRAFGAAQVSVNGRVLSARDWQTQSVRELFFFLAGNRPLSREQLGTALWPNTEDRSKFKMRFKNEIYRLRRAVGQDTILFDGQTYAFNKAIDHESDVEAFEAYLRKAKLAANPADQIEFYQRGIELVGGRYLEDLTSDWIIPEQERLHQAFLSAALALGQLYQNEGQLPKALEISQRTLGRDDTCEALYRLQMEIYGRLGDKGSIVHTYQTCERVLKLRLNVEPSKETRELYRRLTG